MVHKITALFHSRRFWLAVGGVVFTLADGLGLGVTPEQVNHLSYWAALGLLVTL